MPWFLPLLLFVASYVIQALLVKSSSQRPATLEDFDFPQADEGTPQAVVFGDTWSEGWFVAWYGNLRTQKIEAGGKK